jgi:hypothetical protein
MIHCCTTGTRALFYRCPVGGLIFENLWKKLWHKSFCDFCGTSRICRCNVNGCNGLHVPHQGGTRAEQGWNKAERFGRKTNENTLAVERRGRWGSGREANSLSERAGPLSASSVPRAASVSRSCRCCRWGARRGIRRISGICSRRTESCTSR